MTIEKLITAIENRINNKIVYTEYPEMYHFLIPYNNGIIGTSTTKDRVRNTSLHSFEGEQLITDLTTI